jgi:hypothetical protein
MGKRTYEKLSFNNYCQQVNSSTNHQSIFSTNQQQIVSVMQQIEIKHCQNKLLNLADIKLSQHTRQHTFSV